MFRVSTTSRICLSLLLLMNISHHPFAVVKASITFVATSQEDIHSLEQQRSLPDELTVTNVDSIVRKTKLFSSHYSPSMIRYEEEMAGDGKYPTTEIIKDILMIKGSPVSTNGTIKASPYGFIGAATTAYGYHKNLVIRPDDIWITILSQFNFYINARSQNLRNQFVNFDNQKELRVTVQGYTIENAPYDDMTMQFLQLISDNMIDNNNNNNNNNNSTTSEENSSSNIRDWFLPGFTTSTKTDDVVAAACAMCTFQDYFTYVYEIACGIPQVTLEGTIDDWIYLEQKVERIRQYDDGTGILDEWVDYLKIITNNFIESSENGSQNNLDFWDNILYYNSNGYGTPVLSGWITAFSFFNSTGQKMALDPTTLQEVFVPDDVTEKHPRQTFPIVNMDDMNANIISCPAIVDDQTTGMIYNATLFVGQMSFEYTEAGSLDDDNDNIEATSTFVRHQRSDNNNNNPTTTTTTIEPTIGVIKPRNDWALVIEHGEIEVDRPTEYDPYLPIPKFPPHGIRMDEICYWYEHLQFIYDPLEEENHINNDSNITISDTGLSTASENSEEVVIEEDVDGDGEFSKEDDKDKSSDNTLSSSSFVPSWIIVLDPIYQVLTILFMIHLL